MKHVEIFTDGACRGNPGRGGYGTILRYNGRDKEISAGYLKTTNNRMEIMAALVGLEALKEPCEVTLFSDSKYVIDAMTKGWIHGWCKKGWSRGNAGELKNADLWKKLYRISNKHKVHWTWVKGHAGHKENERCDALATEAADGKKLLNDVEFERVNGNAQNLF